MTRKVLGWIAALCTVIALFTYKIPIDDSWSGWSLPLSGKIIVLDAGHGGPDGGAVSKDGLVEKDVTLLITLSLRDFLQQAGALVVLTRENDTDLAHPNTKGLSKRKTEDLIRRARLVKENQGDLLVSIHLNAIPSPKWSGAQVFYHPAYEDSQRCAQLIQSEIRRVINNTDREAKRNHDIYILRASSVPAVLVEVGFLSNENEARLLSDTKYQKKMANAIYQGILRYYSGEKPMSGQ
ncbi:N-acetylmuramoyl-L-alanine amidase CwlD [Aneurinibacillus terranovensis]|uniref:N-acetylmuramoyl-L-alanine amidase CwlD n=1 Tax=Aneurinibacillus terranovensis TaxID=278991 RepID=UPI0004139F26|nr:N-acetylmuramoyl-L-alanine amidase CwlD [Aneurinibacillus terranovensis]